jgi:hypothetical protein
VKNARDVQLERAQDFLKGMLLYEARAKPDARKVASSQVKAAGVGKPQ